MTKKQIFFHPQRFFLDNVPKQTDGTCYVLNSEYGELWAAYGEQEQEIERLQRDLRRANAALVRHGVQQMIPGNHPGNDPEPVSHHPSGQDFDKDLAHLDTVRKTMADMKRYGSLQGIPMQEAEFLLSFIDNLWREYSRSEERLEMAVRPKEKSNSAPSAAIQVAIGPSNEGSRPATVGAVHRTYPDYPVAGIYEAGIGVWNGGTKDEGDV